jgi:hypothetical protein
MALRASLAKPPGRLRAMCRDPASRVSEEDVQTSTEVNR